MHYLAHPPIRTHSTTPISQSTALSALSQFLESAQSNASLHPDAQITDQGILPAQGGGRFGLTLHNLQRIEAGLRGERLQADISLEVPGLGGANQANGDSAQPDGATAAIVGDDWMDKDQFEREQDEDEVLMRDGPNEREDDDDVVGGDHEVVVPDENGDGVNGEAKKKRKKGGDEVVDREARKRAKKERRKAEKAETQARRKAKG